MTPEHRLRHAERVQDGPVDDLTLAARLATTWPHLVWRPVGDVPRTIVVMQSISAYLPPRWQPLLPAYEERYLCYLLGLLSPGTRVVRRSHRRAGPVGRPRTGGPRRRRALLDRLPGRPRRRDLGDVRLGDQPARGRHHAPARHHPRGADRGGYDAESGTFRSAGGTAKFYAATDHLESEAYARLTIDDLMDVLPAARLGWDHESETGTVFHMASAIAGTGTVGLTAIGDSADGARALFERSRAALDEAAARI
jgi:hypothetical protein